MTAETLLESVARRMYEQLAPEAAPWDRVFISTRHDFRKRAVELIRLCVEACAAHSKDSSLLALIPKPVGGVFDTWSAT